MYVSDDINDGIFGGLYRRYDQRLKDWVQRRGLQKEFNARRRALEVNDKLTKNESWIRGMESLLTDYGESDGMLNVDNDGSLIEWVPPGSEVVGGVDGSEVDGDLLDRDVFTGREEHTNYQKSILWVADHVQIRDVTPADAPSPFAWSMLRMIRKSEEAKKNFYFNLLPKILSSMDTEGDEKHVFDDLDVKTYGRLGRIMEECKTMDRVEYALFSGGIKGKS